MPAYIATNPKEEDWASDIIMGVGNPPYIPSPTPGPRRTRKPKPLTAFQIAKREIAELEQRCRDAQAVLTGEAWARYPEDDDEDEYNA